MSLYPLILSLASLLVALGSVAVTWLNYARDTGQISFYVGLGEVFGGAEGAVEVLNFKIVNVGRRPVTLIGIYGDLKWQHFKKFMTWLLGYRTPSWLKRGGFLLPPEVIGEQFMPRGRYQTLAEGGEISILIQGREGQSMARSISKSAANLYLSDSTGRKYFVPNSVMRKLRYDVGNRNA